MAREGDARKPVRIAIIDDHDVVHAGIQAWCGEAEPPIELAASFLQPAEYFAAYTEPSRDIDVVLLDLQTGLPFQMTILQFAVQSDSELACLDVPQL